MRKTSHPCPLIAVIGGSKATPEEAAAAEAVGRVLVEGE